MRAALAADARRVAGLALAEDGPRDLTSDVTVRPDAVGRAAIEFRTGGVLAGVAYADAVAEAAGAGPIAWRAKEGERLEAGAVAGTMEGLLRAILRAERSLLNILQRAGGVATLTRRYVDAVAGTRCRILHTRKTTPGLRLLEVSAVLAGGGSRHRLDLSDTVMVKDNHWRALERNGAPLERALADALARARSEGATSCQVEVESPAQLRIACAAGADRLLVDNQPPETLHAWADEARRLRPGIEIEATGGITLANVRACADAGADYASIGALTHSVVAADVALEVVGSR